MSSKNARHPLVVEFIGATGAGKSTLLAALTRSLSGQGYRVREAEEAILSRYGLAFSRHPKVCSALVHFLALKPLWDCFRTRNGSRLLRLGLDAIAHGTGSIWKDTSLLRNFFKRIGQHLLLEDLRDELPDCDLVLCDEGVVHAAHNLFVHVAAPPRREEIVQFGRIVPKPDLLIWVTAPLAQSVQVIQQRGHARVPATTGAAQAFAEHAHATFEMLAAVEGVQEIIYRVDNVAPGLAHDGAVIQARAAAIGEFLKRHLRRCPQSLPQADGRAAPSRPEPRALQPATNGNERRSLLPVIPGSAGLEGMTSQSFHCNRLSTPSVQTP